MANPSILLLRLEGPLQSWGGRSRWDVRDTQPSPTKSGIIGLLGCALGYSMGDKRLEELDRSLLFGYRVEAAGRVLEDYQTITDYLPTADGRYKHSGIAVGSSVEKLRNDPNATPATIISPRSYLEDASFLAALCEREPGQGILAQCEKALQNPVWPLYLGRKACIPTRPILEDLTTKYSSIQDALQNHWWSVLGAKKEERKNMPKQTQYAYEVVNQDNYVLRQEAMRINPARQYDFITMSEPQYCKPKLKGEVMEQ